MTAGAWGWMLAIARQAKKVRRWLRAALVRWHRSPDFWILLFLILSVLITAVASTLMVEDLHSYGG